MDNKKRTTWILIICNAFWLLWLMYWSYLFISGSPVVDNPDAMLPLERWDRGGWMLTIGVIPLIIVNSLGYVYIQLGTKKSRLLLFIPSIVCVGLVVCYWFKSLYH